MRKVGDDMSKNIFLDIRKNYNVLTKVEKRIADTVLNNPKEVLNLSITDLASTCNVSVATVFRFCKDLNLRGYQEFRLALVESISVQENEQNNFLDYFGNERPITRLQKEMHALLDANMRTLRETSRTLDEQAVKTVVFWMIKARKILLVGCGESLLTAWDAKDRLMWVTDKAEVNLGTTQQKAAAAHLTPDDILIAISHSGVTEDIITVVDLAKKAKAKVVAITCFAQSPLTERCDISLLYGVDSLKEKAAMPPKMARAFITELLFRCYAAEKEKLEKEGLTNA